jgi:hypothetical protein
MNKILQSVTLGGYPSSNVRDDDISDSSLPTPDDSHKRSGALFVGLDVNKGPGPDGITPAILKRLASVVKVPLRDVSCYRGIAIL